MDGVIIKSYVSLLDYYKNSYIGNILFFGVWYGSNIFN